MAGDRRRAPQVVSILSQVSSNTDLVRVVYEDYRMEVMSRRKIYLNGHWSANLHDASSAISTLGSRFLPRTFLENTRDEAFVLTEQLEPFQPSSVYAHDLPKDAAKRRVRSCCTLYEIHTAVSHITSALVTLHDWSDSRNRSTGIVHADLRPVSSTN